MCQIQQQEVEAVGYNSIKRVWKEMIVVWFLVLMKALFPNWSL